MGQAWWWIEIILLVILLIVLIWLVFQRRSKGTNRQTFEGTEREYAQEEERRREGTDDR